MTRSNTPLDEELPGMLAVAKGVAEQKFPHTLDAAVWAAEFIKLHPDADEGAMLGWFANAIMAGYDTAQSRVTDKVKAAEHICGLYFQIAEEIVGADEVRRRFRIRFDRDLSERL